MHLKTLYLLISTAIIIVTMAFAGCSHGSSEERLADVDSLIARSQDDSARAELGRINPRDLTAEDDKAYYNMLKVELIFRNGDVPPNDSMIDTSIARFKETGDWHKLAQSLYFKGRLQYKRSETKGAIKSLLEAGQVAKETEDTTLMAKIYTNLALFNKRIGEYKYARKYIKLAINYIPQINDYPLITNIYQQTSDIYGNLKDTANAIIYLEKCIPLLKFNDENGRAKIYSGLANIYNVKGDFKRAKEYGLRALKNEPGYDTYYIMSKTYRHMNDKAMSDSMWRMAFKMAGTKYRIMMLAKKRAEKLKYGEYQEASVLGDQIIRMRDSANTKRQADSLIEIQATFDVAGNAREEIGRWKKYEAWTAVATIIMAAAIVGYRIREKRARKDFKEKSDRAQQELAEALESNRRLNSELSANLRTLTELRNDSKGLKKTINDLNRQLSGALEANSKLEDVSKGKVEECLVEMYEMVDYIIINNGCIVKWENDKIARFIGYCCSAMPELNGIFDNDYDDLTRQNKLMLILTHLSKTKEEVCTILGMQESAYRKALNRLSKKKKDRAVA